MPVSRESMEMHQYAANLAQRNIEAILFEDDEESQGEEVDEFALHIPDGK